MKKKANILVIEDEAAIRTGLIDVLVFHGYDAGYAEDGDEGLKKALSGGYDLVLLDVMLPGRDGFSVLEEIRKNDREQAVIMLTAKSTDDDIINGLSLGADDYVSKPFSVAQLVLRVQAVLRRTQPDQETATTFELASGIEIDAQNLCGSSGDEQLNFTRREMDMLQYLRSHHTRPVPREELLNKVWGYAREMGVETRTVDIHIAKLRRKIEIKPSHPENLVTVRGAGYRLMIK